MKLAHVMKHFDEVRIFIIFMVGTSGAGILDDPFHRGLNMIWATVFYFFIRYKTHGDLRIVQSKKHWKHQQRLFH